MQNAKLEQRRLISINIRIFSEKPKKAMTFQIRKLSGVCLQALCSPVYDAHLIEILRPDWTQSRKYRLIKFW